MKTITPAFKQIASGLRFPEGPMANTLPDLMVTNVCFGGPDLRTAFATLSMGGTLVSFEWPRPGLALNHLNKP